MTKKVRIENADTSNHVVVVEVWIGGEEIEARKIREMELTNPTDMLDINIWKNGQFLVIREKND